MTKKDFVEQAMVSPTAKIARVMKGYSDYPIPNSYQTAILESLVNLTMGVDEILRYVHDKEKERKIKI